MNWESLLKASLVPELASKSSEANLEESAVKPTNSKFSPTPLTWLQRSLTLS